MELMKSLSTKYHVKTTLLIQHKTVKCFEFMISAGQKLTIVVHAELQNWHSLILLSVTSCKLSFFLWDEKSTLNGEQTPLRGLYVADRLMSLGTYTTLCVILYLCTFSPFPSLHLAFMGTLDGRTRGYFSKGETYWRCNILYTAGKPNK